MENLAKLIYEHYEKFLGEMIGADNYPKWNFQVMGYQDQIHDCVTFATMGLSLHEKELGSCCETVFTTDKDYDACVWLYKQVLDYMLENGIPMDRGLSIGGIDHLDPQFFNAHGKSAMYFTEATMFNPAFRQVDGRCKIYMAFFLSPGEECYLRKHGTEAFEKRLEESKVDIVTLDRKSAC